MSAWRSLNSVRPGASPIAREIARAASSHARWRRLGVRQPGEGVGRIRRERGGPGQRVVRPLLQLDLPGAGRAVEILERGDTGAVLDGEVLRREPQRGLERRPRFVGPVLQPAAVAPAPAGRRRCPAPWPPRSRSAWPRRRCAGSEAGDPRARPRLPPAASTRAAIGACCCRRSSNVKTHALNVKPRTYSRSFGSKAAGAMPNVAANA